MAKVDIEAFGGPKQPSSGYMLFISHNRESIANELGTRAAPQIAKCAGERWAVLGEEDKARYQAQAKELKEKYDADFEKFKQTSSYQEWLQAKKDAKGAKEAKKEAKEAKKEAKEAKLAEKRDREEGKGKKAKRVRAEGEPKRPQSAYFLWMNAEGRAQAKAQNPAASLGEVGKIAGELWKGKTAEEKQEWEDKAKEAKEQYEKDMKVFKEGGAAEAAEGAEESG
eukprot:TRINITY_DN7935_c0_g1_i2.p1 TRINITY_DN7935_c0_g1~~TRINITY_DN7935_c0_g1_i2.p1  ORF type:complete len:248 (+),score=139.01 TRINITY_DN7935_c0_g1_i2:71-745(+)